MELRIKSGTRLASLKPSGTNPKKESRVIKGLITANIPQTTADQSHLIGKSRVSIHNNGQTHQLTESVEQITQLVGKRNNILSSSLQMLGKSVEPSTESRKDYNQSDVILSQQNSKHQLQKGGDVGNNKLHLRYVSQGMQRSASIEGIKHKVGSKKAASRHEEKSGLELGRASNERIKVVPTASTKFRKGLSEKRTMQQVTQNSTRRNGAASANNLTKAGGGGGQTYQMKHNSLVIPSGHNSIIQGDTAGNNTKKVYDATIAFSQGEYGPISLNDERQSSGQVVEIIGDPNQKRNATAHTSINGQNERKNVPLTVSNNVTQRQQYQPSDYQAAKTMNDCQIISGGGGVQGAFTTTASVGGTQPSFAGFDPPLQRKTTTHDGQISKVRGADKAHQQSSSNQSFQSALLQTEQQKAGAFQKTPNAERSLKTAGIGASRRTRISQIESSTNIWEVPLSQKIEFTSKTDSLVCVQQRLDQSQIMKPKEKHMVFQNIPQQNQHNRKPDFRNSTALPKSYKQFVATVSSGQTPAIPQTQKPTSVKQQTLFSGQQQETNLFKQSMNNFSNNIDLRDPLSGGATQKNGQFSKRTSNKKKKDELLQMISQIEFGDNSDTFRALAKQFYIQNIQKDNNRYMRKRQAQQQQEGSINLEKSPDQQQLQPGQQAAQAQAQNPQSNTLANNLFSKNGLQLNKNGSNTLNTQNSGGDKPKDGAKSAQQADILSLQKQLWQQFQLLRILKQTKYQHQLQKCQQKGDGSQPNSGPPGSQAVEYGFEMTEEQMYTKLFLKKTGRDNKQQQQKADKGTEAKDKDANQPYASFDCPECVQMASLMLEEELRYQMSKSGIKRKGGRSKDAFYKHGASQLAKNGQQHKGIAGLSTQGVSLKGYKLAEDVESANYPIVLQDNIFSRGPNSKRTRAQTQQTGQQAKRGSQHQVMDEAQLVGQIFINKAQPQIFFKKQLNQSFRQVVRGEQMTQHTKQNSSISMINCTCGAANQNMIAPNGQQRRHQACVCIQMQQQSRRNYEEPPVPFQYSFQQKQKPKMAAGKHHHGKLHGAQGLGNEGGHSHLGVGGENMTVALDGTVQGHKRKYKPANSIYQPPLQPFKHLATSPVNQTITKVNELVLILFKQKMKTSDQQIIRLFKFFGIQIPRGNGCVLDTKVLKMPDFLHTVNQKLLIKLYRVLNAENAHAKPETSTQIFRFYVGKGNNYPSVRQIISRRTWWNRGNQKQERFYGQKTAGYDNDEVIGSQQPIGPITEDQVLSNKQFSSGCHLIWTQWRKTEHSDFLKRVTIDKVKQKSNDAIHRDQSPKKGSKSRKQIETVSVLNKKVMQAAPLANVPTLIYNRLDDNYHLSNKKALFLNISTYYLAMGINPFEVAIPLTFNVKSPHNSDSEYIKFTRAYNQFSKQKDANIWIIKPGENSNRGTGIEVASSLNEIRQKIQQLSNSNGNRTSIVQKYLDKPLLIHGRKFDIRGYAMITSVNGVMKGYMYRDCYFRTSSKQFDLSNLHSRYIHLTNDAIQINSEDYGKFESGNKLSINDFQRYLDANHSTKNVVFMRDLFPQMERLVTDSFRSVGSKIDPQRLNNTFEIFGYDFMIDENFKVFLIEANTNPSLEICSPLLARIIPELLDNSFRIAIDPLYQPSQFLAKLKDDSSTVVDKVDTSRDANMITSNLKERAVGAMAAAEGDYSLSPHRKLAAGAGTAGSKEATSRGRQRLELLTQIKYTLIYDERIDKPVVDKILADYEQKQMQERQTSVAEAQPREGGVSQSPTKETEGMASQGEGAATSSQAVLESNNERQIFREIVEEEKLDEQAAKKEEIEAAEDEEAGIVRQPLMLMQPMAQVASEDEEDDDLESEDEFFN